MTDDDLVDDIIMDVLAVIDNVWDKTHKENDCKKRNDFAFHKEVLYIP